MSDKVLYEKRTNTGSMLIGIEVGTPVPRKGFEKLLPSGVEVGLPGWDRAHAIGPGFGIEIESSILYAPEEFNREYQNAKIEEYIRGLYKEKLDNVKIYVHTECKAHQHTLRLKEITYKVVLGKSNTLDDYFQVTLSIENKRISPKINISEIRLGSAYYNVESYLKAPARLPVARVIPSRGTDIPSRYTSFKQKGTQVSRTLLDKLNKVYKHTGIAVIKSLPSVLKGVAIYSAIQTINTYLDAIEAIINIRKHGTVIPDISKNVEHISDRLRAANIKVKEIYEDNILGEDIAYIVDNLFNIGDKESIDNIFYILMEHMNRLSDFRKEISDTFQEVQKLQTTLKNNEDKYHIIYEKYSNISFETATKGMALLLWNDFRKLANYLSSILTQTKAAIETLDSLISDVNTMADYVNEHATVIQILRNRDNLGLEVFPKGVKPLESIWGPSITPEF